jgi:hypothetical protein
MSALLPGHRPETSFHPGRSSLLHVTEAPAEILAALEGDSVWDYNIIELERITNKK